MTPKENEPLPLCDPRSEDTAPLLRAALGAARDMLPTRDDLASIAAGLPLGGPGGAGPGGAGPGAADPRPAWGGSGAAGPEAGGAAVVKVSALPGAIAGAALGVLVSAFSLIVVPPEPPPPGSTASSGAGTTAPLAAAESPATPPLASASLSASLSASPSLSAPAALPGSSAEPSQQAVSAPAPGASGDTGPGASAGGGATASANADSGAATSGAGAAPETRAETEVELLNRARLALGSDVSSALALTVEHAARFPTGALAQEREVVAIQALVQLGRSAEASARARRFLAAHPGSAHRPRVEAVLSR